MRHLTTLFLSLLLLTGLAHAGTVTVLDSSGAIPQSQADQLRSNSSRWTFDLKVFTGVFPNRRALDISTHDCVTTPNDVCVGLDTVHHGTNVHFGTGTGVRPADYNFIASSGNSFFKTGDFKGGIENIADRALESSKAASQTVQVHVSAPPPVVVNQTTSPGLGAFAIFLICLITGGVAFAIYALVIRQRKLDKDMESYREERNEYLDANVTRMTSPTPTPVRRTTPPPIPQAARAPAATSAPPAQVVQVNQGNNDLLTGVLIGEALSRPTEVIHTREVVRETHHETPSYSSSHSDDGGGSSSDWGSSSSDSGGSSDGGGGGSDW